MVNDDDDDDDDSLLSQNFCPTQNWGCFSSLVWLYWSTM